MQDSQEPTGEEIASSSGNVSNSNNSSNNNLQDSGFTADSLDENEEQESSSTGGRWFGGIGSDFMNIANCLTDNVSPVVSGVATLVHRTALAVANEIAQLERDGELGAAAVEDERSSFSKKNKDSNVVIGREGIILSSSSFDSTSSISNINKSESLILPWEICQESSQTTVSSSQEKENDDEISVYVTDTDLMKKIFILSRQESTFLGPFSEGLPEGNNKSILLQNTNYSISLSLYSSTFSMNNSRIKLIRRLLNIDENLASMHTGLTGEAKPDSWDTFFWKNYFFHCEGTRANELRRRKQNKSMTKKPCTPTTPTNNDSSSPLLRENIEMNNALDQVDRLFILDGNNNDDESLIPADDDSDIEGQRDDLSSSYVIQSAPNSANTFTTTRSIDDDVVLVDTHSNRKK